MSRGFDLMSSALRLVQAEGAAGRIKLVLPRVVFEEVVTKYVEGVRKHEQAITTAISKLKALRAIPHDAETDFAIPATGAKQDFSQRLRTWVLTGRGEIAVHPDVSHAEVVDRALARRRPFDPEGRKGYRDVLIWHTILDVVTTNDVVLVTDNTGDFAESQDGDKSAKPKRGPKNQEGRTEFPLHPDLVEDLKSSGVVHKVRLFTDLQGFIEAYVSKETKLVHEARSLLEGELLEPLKEAIAISFPPYYELSPEDVSAETNIDAESAHVEHIEWVPDLDIKNVYGLDDHSVGFEVFAWVEAELDLAVHKSDYYTMSDKRLRHLSATETNNWYMSVSSGASLELTCEGVLDTSTKEIRDIRVTQVTVG